MEIIDNKHLDSIKKNSLNKTLDCKDCEKTMLQFFYHMNNIFKYISKTFKIYELSLWIKSKEFYIKRKRCFHEERYRARDILMVELGDNLGGELSYEHPCIVIANDLEKVFIVPCSSSKLNKAYDKNNNLYSEYVIANQNDGFTKKTVVILNNARWIAKSRIIKKYSQKLSKSVYNEVYDKLFNVIFESKSYQLEKLKKKCARLEIENLYLKEYL